MRETGDLTIAIALGVPRSTAAGWLRAGPQDVISLDLVDMRELRLQGELAKLRAFTTGSTGTNASSLSGRVVPGVRRTS